MPFPRMFENLVAKAFICYQALCNRHAKAAKHNSDYTSEGQY